MSRTITIRVPPHLAAWLEETSKRTGVPQGQIIREEIEKARAAGRRQGFMRLSGSVAGPRDLSVRKGFSGR
jgi:hypothetical protein